MVQPPMQLSPLLGHLPVIKSVIRTGEDQGRDRERGPPIVLGVADPSHASAAHDGILIFVALAAARCRSDPSPRDFSAALQEL